MAWAVPSPMICRVMFHFRMSASDSKLVDLLQAALEGAGLRVWRQNEELLLAVEQMRSAGRMP